MRRYPFLWLVWCTAAASAVLFPLAGWLIATGEAPKNLGWDHAPRGEFWYVSSVRPVGPAAGSLQIGDRLVSLNGDPGVARGGAHFYRNELALGESYRLRIGRDDAEHEYTLTSTPAPNPGSNRLVWFLEALVWTGVALFIGFARPDHQVARIAFVGAAVNGILFFLQVGVLQRSTLLIEFFPIHVVLGYHFFYRFPGGVPAGRIPGTLLGLLYAGGAVSVAGAQFMSLIHMTQGASAATLFAGAHQTMLYARAMVAQFVYTAAIVGMVAVIPRNYRLLKEADQRRRIRWVVYGSILGLAPVLLQSGFILSQMLFGTPPLRFFLFGLLANVFTVAIPISVAYVIVKHRVFDASIVLRRGIQYLLAKRALQALLALPALALAYTVVTSRNQTITEVVTGSTGYIYWIIAAGLSLRFRQPLRLWLDRKFFREQYDREQVLVGLLDDLGKLESSSEVSRLVTARLEFALHPKTMYLWFRNHRDWTLVFSSDQSATQISFPDGRLLELVEREDTVLDVPLSPALGLPQEEVRWLSRLNVQLLVPIVGTERNAGLLMLGEKKSEEPYSASDRRLLQAIAKQAAFVRENLVLKARVGEEQRIRHEVLARLDHTVINLLKECPSCGACFDSHAEHCNRDGRVLTLSLPVDRTIDGKYCLDQLIGKGGMGSVYEARDLRLDRSVAVKIMPGRAFGQDVAIRRFQREARAAGGLNHPNIVSIYDYGVFETGGAYIVMERLHGTTLRAEMERSGALHPSVLAEWFEQLLDGVAAAHAREIVHRDLKPENVIGRRQESGSLAVKILDFGLAKLRPLDSEATAGLTESGVVVGTFGYMAPEQILGRTIDHRADIFALGVMLVEGFTGHRPFQGETYGEFVNTLLLDDYHLPGSSPQTQSLDRLLQRCIAKEPQNRLASVVDLQHELVPLLRACSKYNSEK